LPENLLRPNWTNLDQHELRLVLDARIGGPGQYNNRAANPNRFYLPLAGGACKIVLIYNKRKIVAIEAGPAFDAAAWKEITNEINTAILVGPKKIGRDYSFSGHRVVGSWRGDLSGVQILPPLTEAPIAPFERAEHPFILEFPITGAPTDLWSITNHRRIREHGRLSRVLNVLLNPIVKFRPSRENSEHFWAHIPVVPTSPSIFTRAMAWIRRLFGARQSAQGQGSGFGEIRWLQGFFFAPLDHVVTDALSPPSTEKTQELEPDAYYAGAGYDGRPLRVPTDLDDLLCRYRDLADEDLAKFDRAAFWMDMASRQWPMSLSVSFASLVSAVESLTERGTTHLVFCEECNKKMSHDSPGATEQFRFFFEQYAPGASLRERRSTMYALRSNILHGSDLMQIDMDLHFGWDPPGENERELYSELSSITKVALRNWLKTH
jgi:hypothetical protein